MSFVEHVLIALAGRLKSPQDTITLTTTELGEILGVSQQTASRHLIALEEEGLIERRLTGRTYTLSLTDRGAATIEGIHRNLSNFIKGKTKPPKIAGTVKSGLGEGAYYVKVYSKKITQKIGYTPYPGTLNIQHTNPLPDLATHEAATIDAFTKDGRTFGQIKLIPAQLAYKKKKIRCHILLPDRTHHSRELELISGENIKEIYRLKDGDSVAVTL